MPSPQVRSTDDVRQLFDRIAPDYDRLNTLLSLGFHWVWKGMAIGRARVPRGGKVLDICCGSGDLGLQMARCVGKRGEVVGVDISRNLLEIAQRRSQKLGFGDRCRWIQGDALALPFSDNQFDTITMGYGLRNVVDISQALREMARVLKPGGRAVVLDFQRLEGDVSKETVARFQQVYLDGIVVPIATRLGLQADYQYIQDSLQEFPGGGDQVALAVEAGFPEARFYDVAIGLMGMLVLPKPDYSDRVTGVY